MLKIGARAIILGILAWGCASQPSISKHDNRVHFNGTRELDLARAELSNIEKDSAELEAGNRNALPPVPEYEKISTELAKRMRLDQHIRSFLTSSSRVGMPESVRLDFEKRVRSLLETIDKSNTERIKNLIAAYGWLDAKRFGSSTSSAAWLVVQHADKDPVFQKQVLLHLGQLWPWADAPASSYALLADRVSRAESGTQLYGTQGTCVGPGQWQPFNLQQPGNIEILRESMGLAPLNMYKEFLGMQCNPPQSMLEQSEVASTIVRQFFDSAMPKRVPDRAPAQVEPNPHEAIRSKLKEAVSIMEALDRLKSTQGNSLTVNLSKAQRDRFQVELSVIAAPIPQDSCVMLKTQLAKENMEWFNISKYGSEIDRLAGVILARCYTAPSWQKLMVNRLRQLAQESETSAMNFAELYDVLMLRKSGKQWYGTQGRCIEGKWNAAPTAAGPKLKRRWEELKMTSNHIGRCAEAIKEPIVSDRSSSRNHSG